jgi:glutathione S-transferase
MRVICEYQAYAETHLMQIVHAVFFESMDERAEEVTRAMHLVGGEARTIEGRLSGSDWLVGQHVSAADLVVFPGIMLLLRAMEKREAGDLRSRFLPLESTYPAIARWIRRVEGLPGYDRTYPPHWREGAPRG